MRSRLLMFLKERTATDAQACRACGILLLAFSLTIVLPPVVIDLLMGGKALNIMANILAGKERGVGLDLHGRGRAPSLSHAATRRRPIHSESDRSARRANRSLFLATKG